MVNQTINQATRDNQPTNAQPTNKQMKQPTNARTNRQSTNQLTNQPTKQPMTEGTRKTHDQAVNLVGGVVG